MKKIILISAIIISALQTISAKEVKDSLVGKDPIGAVVSAYYNLKNALAKDDGSLASTNAKELFKAIDECSKNKMTDTQHKIWVKYSEKLSYDAEHIKGTTDIDHQREHFVSLSKNMYEVIKAFNTNTAMVYYQFCPMANDGKGASWISEVEKISNPYWFASVIFFLGTGLLINFILFKEI